MNRMTRAARAVCAVALCGAALAACSTYTTGYTCPSATTVPDLQTLANVIADGDATKVESAGRIASVQSSCDKDKAGVATHLSVEFTALRTTPRVEHLDLPYFVAIADSNGAILGKQEFRVDVRFAKNEPTARATENITAHLPLKNAQLGNVYTVIVGFQLTKNELAFNRAHLK
jgi:hypothetical protein